MTGLSHSSSSPGALAAAQVQARGGVLSLRQKIGFGIGDFAFNLYWQATTLYLLYYYTDVQGLSPVTAGWVFGGAMLWDAVCDPIAGYIANRTRTRWGRYRPYLLFGCIPLALSFTAMFIPNDLQGASLLAFVIATHTLFRTIYTVLSMPYNSLMAMLTDDSRERGSLAAYRMISATTAGVVVALATLKLVHVFGGADAKKGFLLVTLLYATLSVPVFLLTFLSTKERAVPDTHSLTLREAVMVVTRNRAFMLVFGITIAQMASTTFLSKTLPYVFKYGVDREDLIGTALGLIALQAFIAIPFWAWVMRRTSKRTVSLAGACIAILSFCLLGAMGMPSVAALLTLLAFVGFANAAASLSLWAMIPDTVEYGEWATGVRGEGVIFGVVSFAHKAALAVAVGAVGHLLDAIGFVANHVQGQRTIEGLWSMLWKGPLLFSAVAAVLAFLYPISAEVHERIVTSLRQRRSSVGQGNM